MLTSILDVFDPVTLTFDLRPPKSVDLQAFIVVTHTPKYGNPTLWATADGQHAQKCGTDRRTVGHHLPSVKQDFVGAKN